MQGFDTQIYFPPGQEFQYSGMGYLYAQATVESVSGMSFDEYLRQSVFEPLNMTDSGYQWRDEWADRVSYGHLTGLNLFVLLGIGFLALWLVVFVLLLLNRILRTRRFPGWRMIGNGFLALFLGAGLMGLISYNTTLPLPLDWSLNREANAASSLYATTDDMAVFLLQFLDSDRWSEIQAQMLAEQIQVDDNLYWGNGVGIQKNRDGRISFWQWGSNIDFQGFMIGYPEEQIGVVILTNSSNGLALVPGIVEQAVGGEQYWWYMLNE
jgi:CubicO group peptidase (beta-lactamase class C family)